MPFISVMQLSSTKFLYTELSDKVVLKMHHNVNCKNKYYLDLSGIVLVRESAFQYGFHNTVQNETKIHIGT